MDERTRNTIYALLAAAALGAGLLAAYSLRDTSAAKFPHQIDQVRPGGVLPRNR